MNVIVVTGATSMIGSALIRSCLRNGISRIYAVVRPGTAKADRLPADARIVTVECAADDYEKLPCLIPEKCDVFYHIAWTLTGTARNDDLLEQAKNVQYTLQAFAAAQALGCGKFVGAGSQAEYGKLDVPSIAPVSPVNPVQAYGIAKYAAGKLVMEAAKKTDISCLWVRIFSVYGIYDKPTTMIASTLRKLIAKEPTAFTKAEQQWDYLYSEDAGDAFYLIGEKSKGHKVYCLGSGESRTLKSFIEDMRDVVNPDAELGLGLIPYTPQTVMHLCADIRTLREDTGFTPKTTFCEGVSQTMRWMQG